MITYFLLFQFLFIMSSYFLKSNSPLLCSYKFVNEKKGRKRRKKKKVGNFLTIG